MCTSMRPHQGPGDGFGNEIERMLTERPATRQMGSGGGGGLGAGPGGPPGNPNTLDELMAELGMLRGERGEVGRHGHGGSCALRQTRAVGPTQTLPADVYGARPVAYASAGRYTYIRAFTHVGSYVYLRE